MKGGDRAERCRCAANHPARLGTVAAVSRAPAAGGAGGAAAARGDAHGFFSPAGITLLLQLQQRRWHFGFKLKPSARFPELEKKEVTVASPLQV